MPRVTTAGGNQGKYTTSRSSSHKRKRGVVVGDRGCRKKSIVCASQLQRGPGGKWNRLAFRILNFSSLRLEKEAAEEYCLAAIVLLFRGRAGVQVAIEVDAALISCRPRQLNIRDR